MKECGILFSRDMVHALLAGRKTQTRRLLNPQPTRSLPNTAPLPNPHGEDWEIHHPLGWRWQKSKNYSCFVADSQGFDAFIESLVHNAPWAAGDRLWVRETWYDDNALRSSEPPPKQPDEFIYYRADGEARDQFEQLEGSGRIWRPSIFMPRWASRILLEVTSVRVERLQDISEADAKAEGVAPLQMDSGSYLPRFEGLWNSINGERAAWESNPFVWVVSFTLAPGAA